MSDFQVYLNKDVTFSSSYVTLRGVISIEQTGKSTVLVNGILTIDFEDEILGFYPLGV
jgi:hypothetical protein